MIIHVCAAVMMRGGKFLLSSRPPGKHLEGKWEFPGGKIEPGETVGQSLVREIAEELSIKIIPLDLIYTVRHEYPDKTVLIHFHRVVPATPGDAAPLPGEGQMVAWAAPEELGGFDFVPADQPVVEQLKLWR